MKAFPMTKSLSFLASGICSNVPFLQQNVFDPDFLCRIKRYTESEKDVSGTDYCDSHCGVRLVEPLSRSPKISSLMEHNLAM
jgi:hypothetical protein